MKVLIAAPIAGTKQYSINRWLQWIADQSHKDYEFAFCVNGENQEQLIEMLKQIEITDIHGQRKKPVILRNRLKEGVETNIIQNITHARESLRQYAIKHQFDKIFFLDSDTIPLLRDAIELLASHNKQAISGVYMYKNTAVTVAVSVKRKTNPTLEDLREAVDKKELIEVVIFGLGCALLDKSVFEKIPFDFKYFGKEVGEDYGYCFAMQERQIDRWIEPRLVCLHLGEEKARPQSQPFFTSRDVKD